MTLTEHPRDMPDPMTSLQYVQLRLAEAVETSNERTKDEQSVILARLLAMAFAATRLSPVTL